MAIEATKRQALEQVPTYLDSVADVTALDVTRDEIRTYTAGVVMVLDQQINTRLEGETVVIHANLTAQVDPHEVTQASPRFEKMRRLNLDCQRSEPK